MWIHLDAFRGALLREADKLGIPRCAVLPDAFISESTLHVQSPSLIKANLHPFHDPADFSFCNLIKTLPLITALDILLEVKIGRSEAGIDVGLK